MTKSAGLDARYGRVNRKRNDKIIAAVLLAVLASIAVWFVAHAFTPQHNIETRDISFKLDNPEKPEITYELTATPNLPTACAIQAMDANHAIVGLKVVTHDAVAEPTVNHSTTLQTIAPATTITVDKCWIVEKKK